MSQTAVGSAFFATALGLCGVAWNDVGLVRVQLPEVSETTARRRMARLHPQAVETPPPAAVSDAIARITALLASGQGDLSDIALDMSGVEGIQAGVYAIARTIPAGRVLTYGEIAARLGQPRASREVGQALGQNPFPIVVPCHRVLGADGKLGGFSAPGGGDTKLRLLAIERAKTTDAPSLFDDLPLSVRRR